MVCEDVKGGGEMVEESRRVCQDVLEVGTFEGAVSWKSGCGFRGF